MQINMRRNARRNTNAAYAVSWKHSDGTTQSAETAALDISNSGLRIRSTAPIEVGTLVYVQGRDGNLCGYSTVRHCQRRNDQYEIGLQFSDEVSEALATGSSHELDYYEFLQISPRAEFATIQRIHRFMASRFHPDNPATGDPEKFLLLNHAYEILSDPERRAAYDASREKQDIGRQPIFENSEFVNGIEGEMNRRLGILSILYNQRRMNSENPRISLYDLEKRMGWPREYLDFTTWYLRSKQYVIREDNSDFSLTALGVDFVETNYTQIPMLNKLLNSGARTMTSESDTQETGRHGALFLLEKAESDAQASESELPGVGKPAV